LSQDGAFIRVESHHLFQLGTPTVVTLVLPPEFTGHNKFIGLKGKAAISRIDEASKGIAVKFSNALRQFERVDVSDLHQDINQERLPTFSGRT